MTQSSDVQGNINKIITYPYFSYGYILTTKEKTDIIILDNYRKRKMYFSFSISRYARSERRERMCKALKYINH